MAANARMPTSNPVKGSEPPVLVVGAGVLSGALSTALVVVGADVVPLSPAPSPSTSLCGQYWAAVGSEWALEQSFWASA
jgi:hypothetical protein